MNKSFAETIYDARKEQGLTLKELSDMTGIAVSQLHGFEKGKFRPWAFNVKKIADALNLSYDELFELSLKK